MVVDFESANDGELIVKGHVSSSKAFKFDSVFSPEDGQGIQPNLRSMLICLLESPNFLAKYCFYTPNTRNCFSEDCTFCNIGVGWIQCLHICIWTDRDRQNLYDGRK